GAVAHIEVVDCNPCRKSSPALRLGSNTCVSSAHGSSFRASFTMLLTSSNSASLKSSSNSRRNPLAVVRIREVAFPDARSSFGKSLGPTTTTNTIAITSSSDQPISSMILYFALFRACPNFQRNPAQFQLNNLPCQSKSTADPEVK